ncbi:MAG: hypothetical protein ACE5OP_05325 [Candidatus Glassbacteria bacterium]
MQSTPRRSPLKICEIILLSVCFFLSAYTQIQAIEIRDIHELVRTADHGALGPVAIFPMGSDGFLVTDRAGRLLLCFDFDGNLKWKTDGTETGERGLLSPGAVASTHGLSVYVLDRGLRKIFSFDRRGAFTGYLVNEAIGNPSSIAQGEGGELYLYDMTKWELVCIEPGGTLRWKVKPWKVNGEVTSIRLAQGEIHLLVPERSTIFSYGKFGEFLREVRLVMPGRDPEERPTAFWRDQEGYIYVCTEEGSLVIYDVLMNPIVNLNSIRGRRLDSPCDLFLSGKKLYLLDCGSQTVYEITIG